MLNAFRICCLGAVATALLVGMPAAWALTPNPICPGDCDEDGVVVVSELVTAVNIALGAMEVSACLAADHSGDGAVTVDELVLAVNNALQGCSQETPLGGRRFSLAPETSSFAIETASISLVSTGLSGFVEFEAGIPDPETGLVDVSITDASEYISMLFAPPGLDPFALCLRPVREALPVVDAGFLSCQGGYDFGIIVTQDHNIGVVGVGGFTEEDCRNAEGVLEGPMDTHPGVCTGPIVTGQPGDDSGPGALLIAADPNTLEGGFPVTILLENALPCGDEGLGEDSLLPLVLTTDLLRVTINHRDNRQHEELQADPEGEVFSCDEWTQENSSGRLVFATPVLHGLMGQDAIFVVVLDD